MPLVGCQVPLVSPVVWTESGREATYALALESKNPFTTLFGISNGSLETSRFSPLDNCSWFGSGSPCGDVRSSEVVISWLLAPLAKVGCCIGTRWTSLAINSFALEVDPICRCLSPLLYKASVYLQSTRPVLHRWQPVCSPEHRSYTRCYQQYCFLAWSVKLSGHTFLDLQLLQASRRYVDPLRSTENEFSLQRKVANMPFSRPFSGKKITANPHPKKG